MPKDEKQNPKSEVQSLKTSPYGITYEKYRLMTKYYYSNHFEIYSQKPSEEELQAKYLTMTDQELMKEYDMYLTELPKYWQDDARKTMPRWLVNTGNVGLLSDYLEHPDPELTYEQQFLLKGMIKSARLQNEIELETQKKIEKGEQPLKRSGITVTQKPDGSETILLNDVKQKAFQTSGNGCWSCFFQTLASAKGVDITQEDIRNYRPNLTKKQASEVTEETHVAYNRDYPNNAIEMGDSVLSFLPNTMLSELMIAAYSDQVKDKGISQEEYVNASYEQIKKTIKHALKDERSPVGVLNAGHYLTIVGIDGDMIHYKNSAGSDIDPNHTYTKSVQELFGETLAGKNPKRSALQFTYATDIKLSKDGKTLLGVPSDYVTMHSDGSLGKQPEEIRSGAQLNPEGDPELNRKGVCVSRYGRVEDTVSEQKFRETTVNKVIMTERVYIPKKLHTEFLRNDAQKRSAAEEERLRQIDRRELGMDRKKLSRPDFVLDLSIAAHEKAKYHDDTNLGSSKKTEEMLAEKQTKEREETARKRVKAAVEATRKQGLEKGFAEIKAGKHPEVLNLQFMTEADYKLEKLTDDDLDKCKSALLPVFGKDLDKSDIIVLEPVLDKFTYKKSPDAEPVNLVEDVRERLSKMPKFRNGIRDYDLYRYARAEMLHLMTVEEADLTYENGENTLRGICSVPPRNPEPLKQTEVLNDPKRNDEKHLAAEIQEAEIPQATDENLFDTVIGLGMSKIDQLTTLYQKIFGKNRDVMPDDITFEFHNKDNSGKDHTEDMTFDQLAKEKRRKTAPESYNPEVWEVNGNTVKSKVNPAKIKMSAAVIGIANGLGVKHNATVKETYLEDGKEKVREKEQVTPIASLKEVAFGLEKKKKQITDKMLSKDISFTPAEGKTYLNIGESVSKIQNSVSAMLAAVEENDSSWVRSSKQFRTMKKKLKELNKLVNKTWTEKIGKGEPITFEMMDEYLQKSDALQQDVNDYLEHKDRQIIKDPARRNASGKQDYEQKRIETNINMLESLQNLSSEVSSAVLNAVSADAKAFFRDDMKREAFRRTDKGITGRQMNDSSFRTFDRMRQLDGEFYTRRTDGHNKETLTQARDRIIGAVNAKYDRTYLEKAKGNHCDLKSAASLAESNYTSHGERATAEDFRTEYDKAKVLYALRRFTLDPEKEAIHNFKRRLLADQPARLQKRSEGDVTFLAETAKRGVSRAEALYGPRPYLHEDFKRNNVVTAEDTEQQHQFTEPYSPIGASKDADARLSDKDFAALAYGAAFTPGAFNAVDKKDYVTPDKETSRAVMQPRFTTELNSELFFGKTDPIGKPYLNVIEYSRQTADYALRDYANGDKSTLAELISTGIQGIVQSNRATIPVCDGLDTEMAARMREMLKRDPELKQLAMQQGLKQQDLDYIDSMEAIVRINERFTEAQHLLCSDIDMTPEERKQHVADYLTYIILAEQADKAIQIRDADAGYKAKIDAFEEDFLKKGNSYGQRVDGGERFWTEQLMMRKMPPKCKFIEGLGKPGALESLQEEVLNMVNSTLFASTRRNIEKNTETIHSHYGISNLLQNYKKAPVGKDGKYDIEEFVKSEIAKKRKAMKKDTQKETKKEVKPEHSAGKN